MKTVYFVRHGESEGNVGPMRQDASTPLTEKGREQASFMALRCANLPIEAFVSSTMERARETAVIINEKVGKEIEYSPIFVERRHASVVYGKPKDHPEAIAADVAARDNFHVPGYKHSDEENFEDLRDRALAALKFLESRKEDHILVVTHGFFMRIVMACVVCGPRLTSYECDRFIKAFHMENTGLTIMEHDPKAEAPWWLWVWNDHAHLADPKNL